MSILSGKRRRDALHFIKVSIILLTPLIRLIDSETNVEVMSDSKAALLQELSGNHLLISASPVNYLIFIRQNKQR